MTTEREEEMRGHQLEVRADQLPAAGRAQRRRRPLGGAAGGEILAVRECCKRGYTLNTVFQNNAFH